jgi:hypothetical protein
MTCRRAGVALGLGALAACALTPPDDMTREVSRYYAAHASEENGACLRPAIASVTERTALDGDRVMVRYTYYEPGGEATDWPSVFRQPVACTGSGERQFTVERTKLGLEVTGMTGPRRD